MTNRRTVNRRGATAVEFALTLPVLLLLAAAVVDIGQYLYVADGMVAAVAEGARAGALADPDDGEDPILTAKAAADLWWTASEIADPLTVDATIVGVAPDAMLVVTGTIGLNPAFGLLHLPAAATYSHTIRLTYQP